MKTLKQLEPLIIQWAIDKNINLPECAPKQRLKLIEECGELASAILKGNLELQKDAIGDIFVVLVILSEQVSKQLNFTDFGKPFLDLQEILYQIIYNGSGNDNDKNLDLTIDFLSDISIKLNLNLIECANIAWEQIKDRKGNTVNGTFIKNK